MCVKEGQDHQRTQITESCCRLKLCLHVMVALLVVVVAGSWLCVFECARETETMWVRVSVCVCVFMRVCVCAHACVSACLYLEVYECVNE